MSRSIPDGGPGLLATPDAIDSIKQVRIDKFYIIYTYVDPERLSKSI